MYSPLKSSNTKNVDTSASDKPSPDMKAKCALVNKIEIGKNKAQDVKPKQTLLTKRMTSPKCSVSPKTRCKAATKTRNQKRLLRKKDSGGNHSTKFSMRNWLITDENKQKQNSNVPCSKNSNLKSSSKRAPEVNSKRVGKQNVSTYFLKYGINVPSFEKIIQEHKKTEKYKKYLENIVLPSCTDAYSPLEKIEDGDNYDEVLDCKHLTLEKIRQAVKRNIKYLKRIYSREQYSERHESFLKQHNLSFDENDLRYNTSTITFTYEQNREMVKILEKEFGDNVPYFFMVLLPELCLKIFMEEHNMSYEEAVEYLEQRPAGGDSDSE